MRNGISRRRFIATSAAGAVALSCGRGGAGERRHVGWLQGARELVREGRLGRLRYAQVYIQGRNRSQGSVRSRLTSALDVLGVGAPVRVSAAGGPVRAGLFPEHFMFTAYYANGLRLVGTTTGRGGPEVTVRGTNGSMFIYPGEVQVTLDNEAPRWCSGGPAEAGWPLSTDNGDGGVQARLVTAMVYESLREARVVFT